MPEYEKETTHNTQLAVQQANSLGNGNGFAHYSVVAAYQIGSLAAGDFQPLCIHIFLPCVLTVVRESDFVSLLFRSRHARRFLLWKKPCPDFSSEVPEF